MRKALRRLKGYMGRVLRDLRRHLSGFSAGALREEICDALVLTGRLLAEKPKDKNKIYRLQEPEVDCISKGKARVRNECGATLSVAATIAEGFFVGALHAREPV